MGMRPVRPSLVCERVRGQISIGLDGESSQLERAMLASHLARCADCRVYEAEVSGLTRALREAPLEPLWRPVVVHARRRPVITRVQVGAAAAVALVALVGAGELMRNKPLAIQPTFIPESRTQVKYPSARQLDREQAMLERAQVGRPVQIQGAAL